MWYSAHVKGLLALMILVGSSSPGHSMRYRCIVTKHNEILCFEPWSGAMFRPERRFDEFVLEVPTL